MNSLELETEIEKIARAMMTRNSQIGRELITYLRARLTLEEVAGVMIISIERLLWFDTDSIFWSIENLIPTDILHEVHRITTLAVSKRLINKGFILGKDFSVDATGKMLVSEQAKRFALTH